MTERTGIITVTSTYGRHEWENGAYLAALRAAVAERVDDGRAYVVRIDPTQATRRGDGISYSRTAYVSLLSADSAEPGEWVHPSREMNYAATATETRDVYELDGRRWLAAGWAWQRLSDEAPISDDDDAPRMSYAADRAIRAALAAMHDKRDDGPQSQAGQGQSD